MNGMFDNVEQLWQFVLVSASVYMDNDEIFYSPIENAPYQITDIRNEIIHLKRQKVDTSNTIGRLLFNSVIEKIKSLGNVIPKGELYSPVIVETTLVMLLPMLDWSDDFKSIIVDQNGGFNGNLSIISEATPDDINERRQNWSRVRRGQNKFRNNLHHIYNGTCVISKCDVEEVLHACHISPHGISGDNMSHNGLLLRADLHDLFDLNLLAIHPKTLKVSVSKKLFDSAYWHFNGVMIAERNDGKKPNTEALNERWKIFNEIN